MIYLDKRRPLISINAWIREKGPASVNVDDRSRRRKTEPKPNSSCIFIGKQGGTKARPVRRRSCWTALRSPSIKLVKASDRKFLPDESAWAWRSLLQFRYVQTRSGRRWRCDGGRGRPEMLDDEFSHHRGEVSRTSFAPPPRAHSLSRSSSLSSSSSTAPFFNPLSPPLNRQRMRAPASCVPRALSPRVFSPILNFEFFLFFILDFFFIQEESGPHWV